MWRWRSRPDDDFSEEIEANIALDTDRFIAEGMSAEEASRAALRAFGNVTRAQERFRESGRMIWLDDLQRDVRYAYRTLVKHPGFTFVAVLTLALGIGATTAIYSVVNSVLLQPLPFPESDRLIRLIEHVPPSVAGRPVRQRGIRYQEVLDWSGRARTLSDSFAIGGTAQALVGTPHGAAGLWGAATSANTFTVLGVRAMLGRTLDPGDDADGNVIVLSFDTWQRHFSADPNVVGTVVELRPGALLGPAPARPMTVVGVLPADFQFSTFPTGPADFYTPLRRPTGSRPGPLVTMVGRLAPDVSLAAAIDELNAIGAAIRPPWPAHAPALTGPRFEIERLKDLAVRHVRPALQILLGAAVVVLLIVCANVANLLLARGTARHREMAVRLAVGASRGRIVRQIVTECVVLATAGGALGAVIGAGGVRLVRQLATVDAPGIFRVMLGSTILPRAHEVHVDATVLAIACAIAAVTSVAFGLLPALHLSRTGQAGTIGLGGKQIGPAAPRTRATLVVAQLGLATLLLVGAGLLTHSFVKLAGNNKGYDASNVVALQLLFPNQYSIARKADTIDTLLTRLRQLPGVQSVGFSRHGLLLGEELTIGPFVPPGRTVEEMRNDPAAPRVRSVSDGFLTAMGVPLLEGRELEPRDTATAPPVVVINRSAARRLFGPARAVGQVVTWHLGELAVQMTVVGLVEDVRQESLVQETFPEIYVDYRQFLSLLEQRPSVTPRQNEWVIGFLSFAIRTSDDSAALPAIRQLVTAVDPNVGIDAMVPMDRLVASSVARERFAAVLLGVIAGVAGLLAAIGVYGVLAYAVAQRTQEIGLRMALGAQRAQVLVLVLRPGVMLTMAGITLGLAAAVAGTRVLQGMLFGITPLDATTFLGVSLMFGLVALLACYVPARRATKVDPMVALRCD